MGVLLQINPSLSFPGAVVVRGGGNGSSVGSMTLHSNGTCTSICQPTASVIAFGPVGDAAAFQAAVRKWFGEKASYRQPALIGAGRTRLCCPLGSASEAATMKYMNSVLV
jgi:hypothetical protein